MEENLVASLEKFPPIVSPRRSALDKKKEYYLKLRAVKKAFAKDGRILINWFNTSGISDPL